MASVTTDTKTRTRTVQFVGLDKKRHSIRLGEVTSKIANEVKGRVEQILACLQMGTAFDADLARWLSKIGSDLHGKLHASGLVQQREEERIPKLQELCDEFLESLPHIRNSTSALMKSSLGRIASRLGVDRRVTEITERDAAGFVRGMQTEKIAKATISKHVQISRRLFNFAMRRKYVTENPFSLIKGGSQVNRERLAFVETSTIQTLLDSITDPEWRLCIALARWGGLRIPSEIRELKWGDIVWDKNRFVVNCVKTSGHDGMGTRVVPIFPQIRPHLDQMFQVAKEGEIYVLPKLRTFAGLSKLLADRIKAAGLTLWLKPWQNMRSTRATELADLFPSHVAAAWLGHSVAISDRHYRQVTDHHFDEAVLGGAKSGAVVVQKGEQSADDSNVSEMIDFPEVIVGEGFIHTESDSINSCSNSRMGVTGLKQPPKTPRITMILPKTTQIPTHRPNCPPILSSLQHVGQTFPNLSGLLSLRW